MFTIGSKNTCFIFRFFCKYELKDWLFKKKVIGLNGSQNLPTDQEWRLLKFHTFSLKGIFLFSVLYINNIYGVFDTHHIVHIMKIYLEAYFFYDNKQLFIYLLTEVVNTSSSSASNGNFTDIVFSLILPRKFSFLRILWRKQGELTKIVRSQMANSSRLSRDICPRSVACSCN